MPAEIGFSTYGILYPPNVAVKLQNSVRGLTTSSFYKFGSVNAVNYACITTQVGASVLFKVSDAVLVTTLTSTAYYLIDEARLIMKEKQ